MIKKISGQIVDVVAGKIFPGEVVFEGKEKGGRKFDVKSLKVQSSKFKENIGKIIEIRRLEKADDVLIMPGFVDAHIHIESSMLVPSRFAEMAVVHGTVATVSDPHEIANVLGRDGIEYMVKDGKRVPFKFFWTAPACVPATEFETSGHKITAEQIQKMLAQSNFVGLSEVMNFPAVIRNDEETLKKIGAAKKYQKPIDGHAPLLSGADLKKYIAAGISTDHECITAKEALEKLKLGMKIWIREGSAAKNLDKLLPIIKDNPDKCGLCSDDLHPNDLNKGHINLLVKRLLAAEIDPILALRMANLNIVQHYKLPVGLLQAGDPADFIVVNNFSDLSILQTWIKGQLVAKDGQSLIKPQPRRIKNNFKAKFKKLGNMQIKYQVSGIKSQENGDSTKTQDLATSTCTVNVIEAIDGQLVTKKSSAKLAIDERGNVLPDVAQDILKIVVADRYGKNNIQVAFIKNFGLKTGAIAASIAHDSHNIIAVGTNDTDLVAAINEIIKIRGGILVINRKKLNNRLNLNIAGLMSTRHGRVVAKKYKRLKKNVKKMGSNLIDPFMTMSFMALPVIPELKITDRGLFDANQWKYINLF